MMQVRFLPAAAAEDAAYAAGFDLVLCNSELRPEKEMEYVWSLIEKRVDGILLHQIRQLNSQQQQEVEDAGIPIVLLNRPPGKSRFSTVLVDNVRGGMLAGEYLGRLGHRKVAHLTSRMPQGNHAVRMKGFREGLQSIDTKIRPLIIKGLQTFRGGYEMGRKLLEAAPDMTAVFAGNDSIAFGVMRALLEAGLRIPDDVSLIGFDNVELSAITHPPLTTIEQPTYSLGKAAVEIVLRLREDKTAPPEHRTFGVRLIERESCRALS